MSTIVRAMSSWICRSKHQRLGDVAVTLSPRRAGHVLLPTMLELQSCRALVVQTQAPPGPAEESNNVQIQPVFRLAREYKDRTALQDVHGEYSYRGLLLSSNQLASQVAARLGKQPGLRIAFLCPNNASYVIAQWATWITGHSAVPLFHQHPVLAMKYCVEDSDSALIMATSSFLKQAKELSQLTGRPLMLIDDALRENAANPGPTNYPSTVTKDLFGAGAEVEDRGQSNEYYSNNDALIVYTSGTTGKPKGVVLTYHNICYHVASLSSACAITSRDVILHTLPLHHVHGIVNALLCPLFVGAKCVMMSHFDSSVVWKHLLATNVPVRDRISLFMAVPTIYLKLLNEYDNTFSKDVHMREYVKNACQKNIRLMICGSASLPVPVLEKWERVTGVKIMERYGMSEVAMALSNPLHGERRTGFVGGPMPHVHVRVAQFQDAEYKVLAEGSFLKTRILQPGAKDVEGELLVKGPTVFRCYWNKPKTTAKEFTQDGWFKTGDTVQYIEGKGFRIVGRTSVDIIKTGGYKVGALEVETHLLAHPNISDCAVIGVPDITWGQRVAAIVVPKEGTEVILSQLREWAKDHMTPYAIPTLLRCVVKLPKNAMGKVNKKELVVEMFPEKTLQSK